jgi:type II secretory pathway pseudopilin PulG
VEVLIAVAVLAIIAAVVFETMAGTIRARNYLDQEDQIARTARTALARFSREVSLAFLTSNSQAVNTYKTVFIGKDDDITDTLWLATRSHRRAYQGAQESDQTEVTWWTEEDPQSEGRLILLHREAPRIDHEPDKGGKVLPLARDVVRFDLRYLDQNNEWKESWDSTGAEQNGRLPRAVELVLVLAAPDPEDEEKTVERSFVQTVLIEGASPLERSALSSDGGGGGSLANGVGALR